LSIETLISHNIYVIIILTSRNWKEKKLEIEIYYDVVQYFCLYTQITCVEIYNRFVYYFMMEFLK